MLRFLITPRWLALHAVFMLAIAFCLVAGWWQYGVYQDSQARHADREATPVQVGELAHPAEAVGEAADRAVTAEGTYLTEHRRFVPGRIHEGVLGWFVLVPLETADGSLLPVVQGWVAEREDADLPEATEARVTGHLLPAEVPEHATMRSDQVLDDNELAYISPESIEEATGLPADTSIHGYLLLTAEEPGTAGVAHLNIQEVAPIRDVNPWQNLSYWAQWWVFGLAALVFWGSAVRSGLRSRRAAEAGGPEPGGLDRPDHRHPAGAHPASPTGTEGPPRTDDAAGPAEVSAPAPRHVPS